MTSVQQIFNEVNEKYVIEYGKLRTDHTVLGQQFAVEDYGHEVIELDASEQERWMEEIMHIPEKWIKDTEAAGLPGQAIYDMYKDLDAEFSDMYGDYGK